MPYGATVGNVPEFLIGEVLWQAAWRRSNARGRPLRGCSGSRRPDGSRSEAASARGRIWMIRMSPVRSPWRKPCVSKRSSTSCSGLRDRRRNDVLEDLRDGDR